MNIDNKITEESKSKSESFLEKRLIGFENSINDLRNLLYRTEQLELKLINKRQNDKMSEESCVSENVLPDKLSLIEKLTMCNETIDSILNDLNNSIDHLEEII